jgi:hypothetical protein
MVNGHCQSKVTTAPTTTTTQNPVAHTHVAPAVQTVSV